MNNDFLDFCRVKKIFEKGFGFLTSIYFDDNVFFHFSMIKDEAAKQNFEGMKRGVVYVFYTSKLQKGKRRVDKIWFDLREVDKGLIQPFILRIIEEFEGSKINIFELAHVVLLLRESGYINYNQFEKILASQTVKRIPSSIKAMLLNEEIGRLEGLDEMIEECRMGKKDYAELKSRILQNMVFNS